MLAYDYTDKCFLRNNYSMIKNNLKIIVLLLLFADITYSFIQHYHLPLDGDMACIIMPSDGYKQLMSDPFGLSALNGDIYPGTNRFFAHWTMATYYKIAPFVCQYVIDPIDSIYLSNAIAKIGIQILIIFLLSVFISKSKNILKKDFLLSAILITPLFQTWGFNGYLGIIDKSITYTFFYALPLALLMIFFLPFYNANISNREVKLHSLLVILLIPFTIFISLNGPLIPAVVLILCPLILLYKWMKNYSESTHSDLLKRIVESIFRINKFELFFFSLIILACLYSIYIGSFNAENFNKTIPLLERYILLAKGLFFQFTKSYGPILLILVIGINTTIIYFIKPNDDRKKLFRILKWLIVFSIIYTILLPFGGYREYRPYIIRWDTFMPVNLCLFYFYGISTLYLINHFSSRIKVAYLIGITLFLLVFTIADKTDYYASTCEKESLKIIAKSPDKIILLDSNCSIMAWGKITNYDDSKYNTQYLQYIGVIKEEKYYYQK